jgi:2-polyprenyl-3-methyl-5-hydroxy-6-metoxy-1,4-benzoquinol methylase
MFDNAVPPDTEMARTVQGLRSVSDEINALSAQIEIGEPQPASLTLRGRVGFLAKRRLSRLLWWQNHQIKALTDLMARCVREETNALDMMSQSVGRPNQQLRQISQSVNTLSENIGRLNRQMQETHHMVFECRRQVRDSERRLEQLEAAESTFEARHSEEFEAEMSSLRQELNQVKNALSLAEGRMADQVLRENAASLKKIAEVAQRIETETARNEQTAAQLSELARRVERETPQEEQMAARMSELGIFSHQTRAALSIHERRLTLFLEEMRKRLPDPSSSERLRDLANEHDRHKYDSLYVAFEDAFRGSREDIKARQRVYLPSLEGCGIGSSEMPVLDLGCGRGEWLELLREQGFCARGIDSNEMMIEFCKSAGLDATQGDALSYLDTLPDACMGAVTSFHMVEHMPFDAVLTLVDGTLRVLKPGGILILETPNPENLLVGAHTFYLDPTHLKPLPSPMLRFFVEARGFCDVNVRELHPFPEAFRLPDDGEGIGSRLNDYLYGPQDYAVIGRKP